MNIILEAFGERVADEIRPSDIDTCWGAHSWTPATKNRYKNVFGKTFKIALADGKVSGNPARLVEQRAEKNTRIRFLTEEEEKRFRTIITAKFPKYLEEFDIALNTGMRKSEQFNLEWTELLFERKRIALDETKNGSKREIPLNRTSFEAFERLYAKRPKRAQVRAYLCFKRSQGMV